MKKTSKPAKSPAPAAKPVAPATAAATPTPIAPVAAKAAPAPAPVAAAPKPAPTPAPAPVAAATPKPVAPTPVKKAATVISAEIDVGFGRALFVRGEGAGLSWTKGLALKNAAADQWSLSLPDVEHPLTFKFLIDDEVWSVGENYTAVPGKSLTFRPVF